MYVQVALPIPTRSLFTYALPVGLSCFPGCLVLVPVGKGQRVGVAWEITQQPVWEGGDVREVSECLTQTPLLDDDLRYLLDWMARYYMRPIGSVVATAMPAHIRFEKQRQAIWKGGDFPPAVLLEPLAECIQKRGCIQITTLAKRFGRTGLDARLKNLVQQGVIQLAETWHSRHENPQNLAELAPPSLSVSPFITQKLNREQEFCVAYFLKALATQCFTPFLLEGVTGSGKTEVYFHAVEACLKINRQVLLLVPEISLTPQLIRRYQDRFQVELAVFHSGMTARTRFDHWQNIRAGRARVVIGARSAIFAPFESLGLIVVDEEHDSSYKQEGQVPYHGRDMAVVRAQRANAVLILGSATPSLESLFNAQKGRYRHLKLTFRATGAAPPTIEMVHLGNPEFKKEMGITKFISPPLRKAIEETLNNRHQVLLFLNRRGYAPSLLCRQCGKAVMCPNCSVTLTLHKIKSRLICHYCDYRQNIVDVCPACGQLSLFHFGPGTEQLEKEVCTTFPEAKVARLDRDTVASGDVDLEKTLNLFNEMKLDILVGTQMIAKGHHFPGLALVGVVLAETALWQPDFRSAERTFQLITQVAGRAGREQIPGRVLVQTFDPSHYALHSVLSYDVAGFAAIENSFRMEVGYPPFQRLALLRISTLVLQAGETFCTELRHRLSPSQDATFLGPAPSPLFKLRNRFRWQLLIKETPGGKLHRFLAALLDLAEGLAAAKVRLELDVDPQTFL